MIERTDFGTTRRGQRVTRFTLTSHDLEVSLLDLGAIVQAIRAPSKDRITANVTLGFNSLAEYERDSHYIGAFVGRYANRIARGRFRLEGREYALARNDEPNHLHGGPLGLHRALWHAEPYQNHGKPGVRFHHTSRDGDEGYPGTLGIELRVELDEARLTFDVRATTDRPTPVNLVQHSYFNLSGDAAPSIVDHELTVFASRYTPVDAALIPTGELRPVAGTPFDFTAPARVGARSDVPDEQLRIGRGYDHNFVLDKPAGRPGPAARLFDPASGRSLEISTTQPGLQFYSGNSLGRAESDGVTPFPWRHGLALEAQRFPDSPNQPGFPDAILRPGGEYREVTSYQFGWE